MLLYMVSLISFAGSSIRINYGTFPVYFSLDDKFHYIEYSGDY